MADVRRRRLALWLLRGVSARAIDAAREAGVLEAEPVDPEALVAAMGVKGRVAEACRAAAPRLEEAALAEERRLAARDGRAILRGEDGYPSALLDLDDPPEVLEVRGRLPGGLERVVDGVPEGAGRDGVRGAAALPEGAGRDDGRGAAALPEGRDRVDGGDAAALPEGRGRGGDGGAGARSTAGVGPPRRRAVAIVGARDAPAEARALARAMGAALAESGVAVISGGALGVDAAAHQGALDAGGATVAVLGSGVLRPLPASHRPLFGRILAGGGALAAELPAEAGARSEHFPRRNRLVAALADGVVVVAAARGSGSLYTAAAARRLGRRLLAVPGGAEAAGCAALIEAGATAVRSAAELLDALELPPPARPAGPLLPPEARRLAAVLGPVPAPLAALGEAAGIGAGDAAAAIATLLAAGVARAAGPGRYARR